MSLALDLLEQADHLSRREPKKPRQASLSRSTSTAYYALFHLLCNEASLVLAPQATSPVRSKLQRMFNHGEMKLASNRFLQTPAAQPILGLLDGPVSDDLRSVALAFVQLQEARHVADYDFDSTWTRAKARAYVQMTRDAISAWSRVRKNGEANIFLLSFLLLKQMDTVR